MLLMLSVRTDMIVICLLHSVETLATICSISQVHKKTKPEVPIEAGNTGKGLLITEDHDD